MVAAMRFLFVVALVCVTALCIYAMPGFTPPGPNVALGSSYTVEPDPNYHLCTDDGDIVQLTDGIFAPSVQMWAFNECVGWNRAKRAVITVDLEQDTPIAGVALSTEAGYAGVGWPAAVLIAVSEDGEQFRLVGDLLHLSTRHGAPPSSGRYVFATDELRCHGRYVKLILLSAGTYTFTDEIEIYQGEDELFEQSGLGEPLGNVDEFVTMKRVPLAIRVRVSRDTVRARDELAASTAPQAMLKRIATALDRVDAANARLVRLPGDDYRAIFPLTSPHRRLFAAIGELRGAEGRPRLELWQNNRWERLSLWGAPPEGRRARVALQVRMMRGERRAETVNIANNSRKPVAARVWFENLPGGTAPDYVSVREVEYVAMASGRWDANALPEAVLEDGKWQITLPAGVSRQLWFVFHPGEEVPPESYRGTVIIETHDGEHLRLPVELIIEPLQ